MADFTTLGNMVTTDDNNKPELMVTVKATGCNYRYTFTMTNSSKQQSILNYTLTFALPIGFGDPVADPNLNPANSDQRPRLSIDATTEDSTAYKWELNGLAPSSSFVSSFTIPYTGAADQPVLIDGIVNWVARISGSQKTEEGSSNKIKDINSII